MKSRIIIVLAGISIGLIARSLFVSDDPSAPHERRFTPAENLQPLNIFQDIRLEDDDLIKPIELPPGQKINATISREELLELTRERIETQFSLYEHDDRALFHAHGEKICASGCAASRHPTEKLPKWKFYQLLGKYAGENLPVDYLPVSNSIPTSGPSEPVADDETRDVTALDELIYFGNQTRQYIIDEGLDSLDQEHADFLTDQLRATHAIIQIRVVDEQGVIRTWLPKTRVPFDRRHVFDMEENNLQPLVTSGTVKRVGLDYLWVRL